METESIYRSTRRHFSRLQKEQILQEHRDLGVPIAELARKNGLNAVTIYQWKRNMTEDDGSITLEKIRALVAENTTLRQHNNLLKIKVADLSVANDILADAISIAKKTEFLKQAKLLEKSKNPKNLK